MIDGVKDKLTVRPAPFTLGEQDKVAKVEDHSTKRVIVTPAVYPRLDEPLHFDIQSTGQKSHCVNITL